MGSSANVTLSNIMISPCRVKFDGVDLGAMEGAATLKFETLTSNIEVAQLGKTVVDMVSNGQNLVLKCKLMEVSPVQLKRVLGNSKLITVGPDSSLYIENQIGQKFSAFAKVLILHPLAKDDADLSGDMKFYKAVAKPTTDINWESDKPQAMEIEFFALPDFAVSPARFAIIGDPSLAVVEATVAAAVADVANIGNGTVSGEDGGTGTKTEQVTATCFAAATDGGFFEVKGQDNRVLGVATVGTLFTADDDSITFTIADGSTDFAVNDSFTFACVGANYA